MSDQPHMSSTAPTPTGGRLAQAFETTSARNGDNFDTLYGTMEILGRALSAQWEGLLAAARPLADLAAGAAGALRPRLGAPAAEAPAGALDSLAARYSLAAAAADSPALDLLVAWDPGMALAEALLVVFVAAPLRGALGARVGRGGGAYQDFLAACKAVGLSATEVGVGLTLAAGMLAFDAFVSLSEDDPADSLGYVVLLLALATFALWGLAVDLQAYYTLSCVGAGDLATRVILMDVLNNGLCLLRIVFCWVRYLFYDLQVEGVDLAFHYTDVANELAPLTLLEGGAWLAPEAAEGGPRPLWAQASPLWALLAPAVDVGFTLVQLLAGLFKFAIALFLLWLLVDLFVLRPLAISEVARRARDRGL